MYKMLEWSTDKNDQIIVLIGGNVYTRKEATALRDELILLLDTGTEPTSEAAAE